ncbi:MAG: N-acetylmuramoyl-L-alanine amidase, partial [Verrucomicrobiota bacterium]|nr:N-acetylmuramoyl-L-alanine amidase [Verrucomicrobiota bacterium]
PHPHLNFGGSILTGLKETLVVWTGFGFKRRMSEPVTSAALRRTENATTQVRTIGFGSRGSCIVEAILPCKHHPCRLGGNRTSRVRWIPGFLACVSLARVELHIAQLRVSSTRVKQTFPGVLALLGALLLSSCSSTAPQNAGADRSEPRLVKMIVPKGKFGRRKEFRLRPRYITVHSTANRGATALDHGRGMAAGAFRGRSRWNRTGYLTWHFTVDDRRVVQHLPLNIQGEHADHEGPGNRTSIAIEICEFRERRRQAAAIERAARLVASLRRQYGVPIDHVVPHYHWPQRHFGNAHKPCPRILMDRGRPGAKWRAFLKRVQSY